jgi:glycosyltransferase involved in cell wall biosynthesis
LELIFERISELLEKDHQINHFYVNSKKSRLWNIREAKKHQGDVNHITGDVNWIAYGLSSKNTILTVHDIGHYVNTLKGIKKAIYGYIWWKLPLKGVREITAISGYTKSEIIKYFNVLEHKVSIIHDPLFPGFSIKETAFNKSCPSILQVGSMANKNVHRLIEACVDIPCRLLLLRNFNNELKKKMDSLNIRYKFFSKISDEEVVKLYQQSDILYQASTYEGFGLPIIEAQATGIPVITSSIGPMPEVAGEGAYYVDPYQVSDIRKGIIKIINDDIYRQQLVRHGLVNIKRFDILEISRQYANLYEKIVNP